MKERKKYSESWSLLVCIWGGLIFFLGFAVAFSYLQQKSNGINFTDKRQERERKLILEEVVKNQEEIISGWNLDTVMEAEAERMVTEKSAPMQDAAQRARPLPISTQ